MDGEEYKYNATLATGQKENEATVATDKNEYNVRSTTSVKEDDAKLNLNDVLLATSSMFIPNSNSGS